MPVSVCPTTVVDAPAAVIWALVGAPDQYGTWAGADVVSVIPTGPVAAGQRIRLTTRELGLTFKVGIDILEVEVPGSLRLKVTLPFGVVNYEHIVISPISDRQARLTFN